jgi:hypothetical protein
MMSSVRRSVLAVAVLGLAGLVQCSTAQAQVMYEFGTAYTDDSAAPAGTPPWLIATFADVNPTQVLLSLQAKLQDPDEFFGSVGFNLTGSTAGLTASAPDAGEAYTFVVPASDSLGGGGSGSGTFDFGFNFPTGSGENRFLGTDTMTILLTRTSGLSSQSFVDTNGAGQYGGVHIQGIGPGGELSGKFVPATAVPEASSLILGGMVGLLGVGYSWRRRKRAAA